MRLIGEKGNCAKSARCKHASGAYEEPTLQKMGIFFGKDRTWEVSLTAREGS